MTVKDRVGGALNRALHDLFAARGQLMLLGEDIADPYGGAFGITRGLSARYPGRVFSTPVSEGAIVGMAGGLALGGDAVIVEIMFGDFVTLCFDPIVNFLTKSVSMYGQRLPMPVVLRCPVGGNRGYGPTHSQSLQKHFLGIPHLSLYELSPLHPVLPVFEQMLDSREPAIFFEDKVLYAQPRYGHDQADALFRSTQVGGSADWVRVAADDARPAWVVLAPGGLVRRVLAAMRTVLVEAEIVCHLLTPARLFPLDLEPVLPLLCQAERILVVEDGVAGGGWAAELARDIHERLWGRLRHPVRLLQPPCQVIPAARHLERRLLVQESTISRVLSGADNE
jgi:pyruvate dehydrogenase E1 component beta subunit